MNTTHTFERRLNLLALVRWLGVLLLLCLMLGQPAPAQAQSTASQRLADVIQSNGRGTINLLLGTGNTPINVSEVEQLRLQHWEVTTGSPRYYLTLGVDVNENNKGLETATAQGVAIASVTLTVQWPGVTRSYTDFRTATQALILPAGSNTRQRYYTLLGEGGSSRITGSNSIQNKFDSTLDIFVPDSLNGATAMTLEVVLLDTNKTRPVAEPESFYDYSGGYEDLALLNREDAYYLNAVLPATTSFQTASPTVEVVDNSGSTDTAASPAFPVVVAWNYFPSATGWYHIAYEDNFPDRGDYDFNDAVVAYRYKLGLDSDGKVVQIDAESYLLADGAWYILDWNFRLPVLGQGASSCTVRRPGQATASVCPSSLSGNVLQATPYQGIDNIGSWFGLSTTEAYVNVMCNQSVRAGPHMRLSVVLSSPIAQSSVGEAAPTLTVRERAVQIDPTQRDARGYPYAMLMPAGWKPACEGVDLGLAYPKLAAFLSSGGTQSKDWYLSPQSDKVVDLGSSWAWDP